MIALRAHSCSIMIAVVAAFTSAVLGEQVLDGPMPTARVRNSQSTSDEENSNGSKAATFFFGLAIMTVTVGVTFAVFKCIRRCEQRNANQPQRPVSPAPAPQSTPPVSEPSKFASAQKVEKPVSVPVRVEIPYLCACGKVHVGHVSGLPPPLRKTTNIPGTRDYKSPAIRRPSDPNVCDRKEIEEKLEHVLATKVSPCVPVELNSCSGCCGHAAAAHGTGVGVSDGVGMGIGMCIAGIETEKDANACERDYREEAYYQDQGCGHGSDRESGTGLEMFPSSLGAQRTLGGGGFGGYSPI